MEALRAEAQNRPVAERLGAESDAHTLTHSPVFTERLLCTRPGRGADGRTARREKGAVSSLLDPTSQPAEANNQTNMSGKSSGLCQGLDCSGE